MIRDYFYITLAPLPILQIQTYQLKIKPSYADLTTFIFLKETLLRAMSTRT